MTTAKEIILELETLFPNELRAKWDTTDGLVSGNVDVDVKNVTISLEFRENINLKNADMIIIHHPPTFGSEKNVTNPFYKKIVVDNTPIYAIHSRIDKIGFVSKAIAENLFKTAGYKIVKILDDGTAIVELNDLTNMNTMTDLIKQKLNLKTLNHITKKNDVKRIAIHGGEGFNHHHVIDAMKEQVDLYLAGDLSHHLAEHAHFFDSNFIDIGHFSEQEGMKSLAELLKKKFHTVEFKYVEQSPLWVTK
jgi:dinuclear metal center YbgI/SA1388 family protein